MIAQDKLSMLNSFYFSMCCVRWTKTGSYVMHQINSHRTYYILVKVCLSSVWCTDNIAMAIQQVQLNSFSYYLVVFVTLLSCTVIVTSETHSTTDCPPWFFFNSTSSHCQCYQNVSLERDIQCTPTSVSIGLGNCMTYENEKDTFFAKCFYFQTPNVTVTSHGYFSVPSNASELNDFMCGPMNRKGLVCSECIDGFGPSATSYGFMCANCSNFWSGVLLYILIEFVPTTIIYIIVLTFRISMTSAPMTGFIFYCQLVDYALFKDPVIMNKMVTESHSEEVRHVLTLAGSFYGIWNLDLIKYWLPPLCISSRISIIHVQFLGCVGALYSLFLIIVTWICVELHGHNFRLIVLIWKPFHRCFVRLRKGYDTKKDIIDVFATFLLLTTSKLAYLAVQILGNQYLLKNGHQFRKVNLYDPTIEYMSREHRPFVIVSVLIVIVFVIPPPFILLFYHTRAFRMCLTKCKLNGRHGIVLHTFVEKFYGCCKDGSNGGRDMRCFSALYFLLRPLVIFMYLIRLYHLWSHMWVISTILFVSFSLLIAFVKPYKKTYMNISDTLMLALVALLSLLLTTEFENPVITPLTVGSLMFIPMIVFLIVIFLKSFCKLKNMCKKCKRSIKKSCVATYEDEHQSLLSPTVITSSKMSTYSSI